MDERLQYIAELLEQIRALLSVRPANAASSLSSSAGAVQVANTPLPVSIVGSVNTNLQEPLQVEGTGEAAPEKYLTVRLSDGQQYYVAGGASREPIRCAVVNITSSATIVPAQGAGTKIRVLAFYLNTVLTNVSVKFRSGTTDLTGFLILPVGLACPHGLFECGENQPLNLCINDGSGGCMRSSQSMLEPVTGFVTYIVL